MAEFIDLAKCVLYNVPAWGVSNEIVAAYKRLPCTKIIEGLEFGQVCKFVLLHVRGC